MNDLHRLLDDAAHSPGATASAPADDLGRARTALTRRRRRRYSLALAGVATSAVLAVGVTAVVSADPGPTGNGDSAESVAPDAPSTTSDDAGGVRLVAETLEAGPYTFDQTPQGWVVEHVGPFGVTISPDDGSVDPDPSVFTGKLVIMFDTNPLGGNQLVVDGRTFASTGDSGYTTISTPTQAGEPTGVVRVQFPDDAGWTQDVMIDFLASVHVGAGAQPGLG